MSNHSPIFSPPPKLVDEWFDRARKLSSTPLGVTRKVAEWAAQWGADQELEACVNWLDREGWSGESRQLRAARRPKPPSLKEQALAKLMKLEIDEPGYEGTYDTLRRALEALND